MAAPLRRLICRHEFSWSERRQCERCYRCGATRDAAASGTELTPVSDTAPAPSTRPRRDLLLSHLIRLAQGESLTRAETIDALLAMIEDSQSSDPVLAGDVAADYFGRLSRAPRFDA